MGTKGDSWWGEREGDERVRCGLPDSPFLERIQADRHRFTAMLCWCVCKSVCLCGGDHVHLKGFRALYLCCGMLLFVGCWVGKHVLKQHMVCLHICFQFHKLRRNRHGVRVLVLLW